MTVHGRMLHVTQPVPTIKPSAGESTCALLRIAVPSPLFRTFDYLPPPDNPGTLQPGVRVCVPFGRRNVIGVLLDLTQQTNVTPAKLRHAIEILDHQPVVPADMLALMRWASRYYHHPIGTVLTTVLPPALRRRHTSRPAVECYYRLSAQGREHLGALTPRNAPKQTAVLQFLAGQERPVTRRELVLATGCAPGTLKRLLERQWLETVPPPQTPPLPTQPAQDLNASQQHAYEGIITALDRFQVNVLHGVTGSGKTEVYLHLITSVLQKGRQALVLVPEIGLTPQLLQRFRRRLPVPIAVLHSNLSAGERLQAWQAASRGEARVIVGTRSAVFTPAPELGLIILDEEHDLSFKQQDGFRYSARDVAIVRARQRRIPVVLGSATPSLETLYNCRQGRYRVFHLPERAGGAIKPAIHLLDIKAQPRLGKLARVLVERIGQHLDQNGQVLVFLNRRGFAPTLVCHHCGWAGQCRHCDIHLTFHQSDDTLRCHHCGHVEKKPPHCPACQGDDFVYLGYGTERVVDTLATVFPDVPIVRIDRDTTRRKGALETLLGSVRQGQRQILVGTQMLAKGHHFPNVTLVAVLDADSGLFSSDFRATERMAQLVIQVAGRAGRADKPGEVLIQTYHPHHPLLRTLVTQGYSGFAELALAEREAAQLPPFSFLTLWRADAREPGPAHRFLDKVAAIARQHQRGCNNVELFGPVAAPMPRRAGKHRFQLLWQAASRTAMQHLLDAVVPRVDALPEARKVRWSVDVDAQELF